MKSINLVNQAAGIYEQPADAGLIWEFQYERSSEILVMGWLVPFIIMIIMSNFVYLIAPNTADRLGFLTTMGLSIMMLISMISLPNPPKPDLDPLINKLYIVALGAMIVQIIVEVLILFTNEILFLGL